jgi:saposin
MCAQDTQKQILQYAKEACQTLGPNFQDQCLNYVELYGPLVINMVVQVLPQMHPFTLRAPSCASAHL